MRKIDIIANEKFNGDMKQTIEYLMFNSTEGALDEHVKDLTIEEKKIVFAFAKNEMIKHFGGKGNFKKELYKNGALYDLDLTEEEVRLSEVNPYKSDVLKGLLKLLIVDGGIIAITLASNNLGFDPSNIGMIGSLATGIASVTLASNLLNYVKFKKAKKIIDNKYLNESVETRSKGRGR